MRRHVGSHPSKHRRATGLLPNYLVAGKSLGICSTGAQPSVSVRHGYVLFLGQGKEVLVRSEASRSFPPYYLIYHLSQRKSPQSTFHTTLQPLLQAPKVYTQCCSPKDQATRPLHLHPQSAAVEASRQICHPSSTELKAGSHHEQIQAQQLRTLHPTRASAICL